MSERVVRYSEAGSGVGGGCERDEDAVDQPRRDVRAG